MLSLTKLDRLPSQLLRMEQRVRSYYYKYFWRAKDRKLSSQISTKFSLIENLIRIIPVEDEWNLDEEEKHRIIEKANKALAGVYNLLGSGDVVILPIQWNLDFVSGYVWANKYHKSYDQINIKSNSDVKKPRELSRSHHMLHCAIAYRLTGEKKYADLVIDQILDWNQHNPLMYSINWGCAMDVAIRAVNWMWALRLISDYKRVSEYDNLFSNLLYKHGWFIYRNLEKSLYNNQNHYLSDILGLVFLGTLFKDVDAEAAQWYSEGKREIYKELRYEILPSGVSYEKSTSYNRLVLEIFFHSLWLLKHNGEVLPLDIAQRMRNMFDFILHTIQPDGNTPIIGDQDNGRILPFGTETVTDYRYLMSIAATLFHSSDYSSTSNGYNIYCALLGDRNSRETFPVVTSHDKHIASVAYPDAGYFVFRNDNYYVLFNCTGKGKYPELSDGTHTHSDLLSFVLCFNGHPVFCDSGSYQYSGNADERMAFRSTRQHNTITVDEMSQHDIKKNRLWDFPNNAIPVIHEWQVGEKEDYVEASHNGYERLASPVTHRRKLVLKKTDNEVQIEDILSFKGNQNHSFESNFYLDDAVEVKEVDGYSVCLVVNGITLNISFDSSKPMRLMIKDARISKSYGMAIDTKRISLTVESSETFSIKTTIKQ